MYMVTRKAFREHIWSRRFRPRKYARALLRQARKRFRPLQRTLGRAAKIAARNFVWGTRLGVWRTRTLKQASRKGAVPLEWKDYKLGQVANRLWIRTVQRTVSGAAASGKPIIVGPWLSEVGFELMYWIPFLRWAQSYAGIDPARLWVVSRGGTAAWYGPLADNYLEIFSHFAPAEFVAGNLARETEQGGRKHRDLSAFDREIIAWASQRIGTTDVEVLHPSLMYNLFQAYFMKHASIRLVEAFSYYRRLEAASAPVPVVLPEEYIAVKFYWSDSLPDREPNRRFVADTIRTLARRLPVVSLDTGMRFDDHDGYAAGTRGRVIVPEALADPATNLAVQTTIIGGATAFYGTYGGFSYLAPLLGVRTAAFYSQADAFRTEHLDLANRVFAALECPSFMALSTTDLDGLRIG